MRKADVKKWGIDYGFDAAKFAIFDEKLTSADAVREAVDAAQRCAQAHRTDRHEDVATADADLSQTLSRNTASMLLGDGTGALSVKQTYADNLNRPFAIDLGDLDGDGDLDLLIENGLIARVGRAMPVDEAQVIDLPRGAVVCPGLIDMHGVWLDKS